MINKDLTTETVDKEIKESCIPNIIFKRNEYGLICNQDVKYVYETNGMINWRSMIPNKFLVANRQLFEKNGKQAPKDTTGLDDRELLILLGGIKELAQIRGYTNVNYNIISPSPEYVIATCSITWIPNYETEGKEIIFTAIGDASITNTSSFGKMYLGPIAENRAFVRSVRNFLKINIVGQDEVNIPIVGGASNPDTKLVTNVLTQLMAETGITFEKIQQKLLDEKFIDDQGKQAGSYTCINDIPTDQQFALIARIKKQIAKK